MLPHADQATVEGAGHLAASTHPHEVPQLLVQHLRRHPRQGLVIGAELSGGILREDIPLVHRVEEMLSRRQDAPIHVGSTCHGSTEVGVTLRSCW